MHDTPEARLATLGLQLPEPAPALGNYLPWCIAGDTFMTSGQFPWLAGSVRYRGQLGRDLDLEQGYAACSLAALNAIAQLKQALGELSRVRQIVRLEGVLNVTEGQTEHPKALDGASDLITRVFDRKGQHTRMIWTNPVMPMDSVCMVYLFARVDPH